MIHGEMHRNEFPPPLLIVKWKGGFLDDPEKFNIGSPATEFGGNDFMDQDADEVDDGPNISSERRLKSPIRAPATKIDKNVHEEEPDTTIIILDELSEE